MSTNDRDVLARRVKAERIARDLSQEALALAVKSSRSTIHSLEKGDRNVGFDVIEDLAKFFNASVYDLFSPESNREENFVPEIKTQSDKDMYSANLKTLLARKAMKPAELAMKTDIELPTLYSYLSGGRGPKAGNQRKIAAAFGVNLQDMVKRIELRKDDTLPKPIPSTKDSDLRSLERMVDSLNERVIKGFARIEALLEKKK